MSWLLDTCAISEKLQKHPNMSFVRWLEAQAVDDLYISVISVGEIRKGIDLLPKSARQAKLNEWLEDDLLPFFNGRTLGLGVDEFLLWGKQFARCQLLGQTPPVIDSLIAATALTNGLTIVTRNSSDFLPFGVNVLNPWF